MSNAYRDPLASLRGQIEQKRATAVDLDRRVGPLRRLGLGIEERARLELLLERVATAPANAQTIGELTAIDRDLEAWQDALSRALEATTDALNFDDEIVLPAPMLLDAAGELVPRGIDEVKTKLETALVDVRRWSADAFAGELQAGGGRLLVEVEVMVRVDEIGRSSVAGLTISMRAAMPGLGSFRVDPLPSVAAYREKLGLVNKPVPIAELTRDLLAMFRPRRAKKAPSLKFRDVFAITGDHALAKALLSRETRSALRDLDDVSLLEPPSARRFPYLVIEPGALELAYSRTWHGLETELYLPIAAGITAAIHRTIRAA